MPRFFTKRNKHTYVNAVTGQAEPSKPTEGWYITHRPNTGHEFYVNLSGKYGSLYKSQLKAKDPNTYNELMKILPTITSPSLYSRERIEEFQRSNPKAVAPVNMLTSANLARKLEAAERAREVAERELAELKRQMASGVPPVATVSNNPAVVKFKKMLTMGIPRTAIDQKMRMEGLDPSMLNGAAPATVVNAPSASFRPSGNPMAGLMSGILGGPGGLKKTDGPKKTVVENAPKDPKKQAAMGMAEAAAAKRAEMAARGNTRSIEERLANSKKAKVPEPINPFKAAITGFNKSKLANVTARRGSNTNLRLSTSDPSSPKTPKNRRANRKGSRKNRRANFRT